MRLYHNPRCSKSRAALALLQDAGVPFEVALYLEAPLTEAFFKEVIAQLGDSAVRQGEAVYKEQVRGRALSEAALARLMQLHPLLLERPLLEKDGRFFVARPPESVIPDVLKGIAK